MQLYDKLWRWNLLDPLHIKGRDTVMKVLRELDPDGTEQRYRSEGPNTCWHVDGYDKLKSYGLPIHGCIDGYSRKIIWLNVSRSNNKSLVPASYYLDTVKSLRFCPKKIRTDCGTENGIMADAHCFLVSNEHIISMDRHLQTRE